MRGMHEPMRRMLLSASTPSIFDSSWFTTCVCMRAAVRARKMDDRQSTDIRARQSPKICMDEADATSANSTHLVEFAEVASATCSSGATSPRLRNNEHKSKLHVRAPHVCVPRLQKSRKSCPIHLYVVLRSTVKRVSQMRDRGGAGAEH